MIKVRFYQINTVFNSDVFVDRKTPFTEQIEGFNSFMNINRNWNSEIKPDLSDFIIESKVNLPDFIDITNGPLAMGGLTLHKRILEIISSYNLMNYKLYFFNEDINNSLFNYRFFHLMSRLNIDNNLDALIDFNKSKFYRFNRENEESTLIGYKKFADYQNEWRNLGSKLIIKAKDIFFSSNFQDFDLFRNPLDSKILISERLRNRLIEENVTGIEIKESDIEFYLVGEV